MPEIAVVFTGGDSPGPSAVADLSDDRFVVAADSGLHHAHDLGVAVDIAVGDFDSVAPELLRQTEASGVRIERHPTEKDQTDLEIALDRALQSGAPRVVVIGGHGGRLDHWLGNVALLASSKYESVGVEARAGTSRLFVVRRQVTVRGEPGEYVTLLAWHGPATGVSTEGLRWRLHDERLEPGSSRGVSNELVTDTASVEVGGGVVLVVLPGERSPGAGGVHRRP